MLTPLISIHWVLSTRYQLVLSQDGDDVWRREEIGANALDRGSAQENDIYEYLTFPQYLRRWLASCRSFRVSLPK
ncbi:hypothetical protein F5B17DRAFT_205855 [Nemania serpens]|nr:hypothetical protein F5B17DRAFT_205855 [Nemania serpens]